MDKVHGMPEEGIYVGLILSISHIDAPKIAMAFMITVLNLFVDPTNE